MDGEEEEGDRDEDDETEEEEDDLECVGRAEDGSLAGGKAEDEADAFDDDG